MLKFTKLICSVYRCGELIHILSIITIFKNNQINSPVYLE